MLTCRSVVTRLSSRRKLASCLNDSPRWQRHSSTGMCLQYSENGDPEKVIMMKEIILPVPSGNQVLMKMLAAPVNPSDINTIQGVYAVQPSLPSIPGNEGVGEVVAVGDGCRGLLEPGDWVIPRVNAMGTWRTHIVASHTDLIKVPSDGDLVTAATIAVNPGTAYRMLKDFVPVSSGDTVIQNGANSAVGQAVIQIAASFGINTINVVRNRPNLDELKDYLTRLGATVVVTEEELRKCKSIKALPSPQLALNCVSGRNGTEILRQLAHGGVMVTYGGMSRQPVIGPVGSLIFSDVTLRGFWMTRWNKEHFNDSQRQQMFNDLFHLAQTGKLKPPDYTLVPFADHIVALQNAMPKEGMLGKKQVLLF